MKRFALFFLSLVLAGAAATAQTAPAPAAPAAVKKLAVIVDGIENGQPIPAKFAYCAPDAKEHTKPGGNINPAISWKGAPKTTKSFAIIVVDRDVPTNFDNAGKEGVTIQADMPRQDFYHWVLVDIPATVTRIAEGQDSKGITENGKPIGKIAYGVSGQNDYAKFYRGTYGGYDGPCPPWNDELLHRYHFIVYALDVATLGFPAAPNGVQAIAAMQGHILAQGEVMGTYTQNPKVK